MSSCAASCCTCCPPAFIASATTACSPTPTASATSPPLASFCISRRPSLPPTSAAPGLPSCADTAAPRCSSSRPSRALSTSVARRVLRPHHDRHRVNQQNFHGGIFLNDAVANARGLVLQNGPVSARYSPL